jgi:four helix bundle protein
MNTIRTYKDLDLWQVSMGFVADVYRVTKEFPSEEKYGLCMQLRRAAVSIPSNIAEGSSRKTTRQMIHFLYIALGSLAEVETQIEISRDLNFIKEIGLLEEKIVRIRNMLLGLVKAVREKT